MSEENNQTKLEEEDGLLKEDIPYTTINKWEDLNIDVNILRSIYSYGFENPSPIQCKAIMSIIEKRDIIAQAQSGTGKTAAFTIGALGRIDLTKNTNQILMLAPTRELALQIFSVVSGLSSMVEGLNIKTIIGGSSIDIDIESMRNAKPHIIVGCPGRVYDMIRRHHIKARELQLAIFDEADEMLSSTFKDQVYNIFQSFNKDIQVALFSATLPPPIYNITNKFMRNPVKISVLPEKLTLEGIKQFYVAVEDDNDKFHVLKDLYAYISVSQCMIYCNSVKRVIDLYEAMREDNFPVSHIHSEMEKGKREKNFNEFRTGTSRVLISTNLTARGIDIQQVSIVINFDIPKDISTYIHRIGRSGRWGRKGIGINLITRRDVAKMKEIERYYRCEINELPANLSLLMN